jgi:hypothetical protein
VITLCRYSELVVAGAAWPRLDDYLVQPVGTRLPRATGWKRLYWIVIDVVLVFLSYKQGSMPMALLNFLFIAIAIGGFIAWRRRFQAQVQAQAVPA